MANSNDITRARRFPSLVVGNKPVAERRPSHPGVALTIDDDGGFLPPKMTSAERDALVARYANDERHGPLPTGTMIFNTDTGGLEVWNSGSNVWDSAGGGGGGGSSLPGDAIGFLYNDGAGTLSWQPINTATMTDNGDGTYTFVDGSGNATIINVQATSTNIPPAATDSVGAVGTSTVAAREDHKHPAQLPSADAGNIIVVGSDGLHYASVPDEVVSNGSALTGAAPAGAQWGIDTATGAAFYVDGAGNWQPFSVVTADLNITVSDQSGGTLGAAPVAPPALPDIGDVHLEVYNDFLVWWSWNGSAWAVAAQVPTAPNAGTATPLGPVAGGAAGASNNYAREDHQHPIQNPSSDANNAISAGSDGLHFLDSALIAPEIIHGGSTPTGTPPAGAKMAVDFNQTSPLYIVRAGNWTHLDFNERSKYTRTFTPSDWTASGSIQTLTIPKTQHGINIVSRVSVWESVGGGRYDLVMVDTAILLDGSVQLSIPSTVAAFPGKYEIG